MNFKIINYSDNARHCFNTTTTNYADIYDAILRTTTKLTEAYASDIIWDFYHTIIPNTKHQIPFVELLTFNENGVRTGCIEEEVGCVSRNTQKVEGGLQYWLLTYTPNSDCGEIKMEFKRVRLSPVI